MSILGIDLGGTKASFAIFNMQGDILLKDTLFLEKRNGSEVGKLITEKTTSILTQSGSASDTVRSIGISVPGIYHSGSGTVWAPNIPGWEKYPLLGEVKACSKGLPVFIDSDRACSILGETWKGNAKGCKDAVFLAIGTGIGAGILTDGRILRGRGDIAGAAGWMALNMPFDDKYKSCGCFEYYASGEGITRTAREYLSEHKRYNGELRKKSPGEITARDVFSAYERGDQAAAYVIEKSIKYWGMAVANLVSLFNPEKVILGGGIFGPAIRFIGEIRDQAKKWGQPISMESVSIESSSLGGDAAVCGAAYLAHEYLKEKIQ